MFRGRRYRTYALAEASRFRGHVWRMPNGLTPAAMLRHDKTLAEMYTSDVLD